MTKSFLTIAAVIVCLVAMTTGADAHWHPTGITGISGITGIAGIGTTGITGIGVIGVTSDRSNARRLRG
jgi:hypothetical protein